MQVAVLLYIDPGTGSMLFTILLSVLSIGIYFLKDSFLKMAVFFSGGRKTRDTKEYSTVIFSDDKRYWNVFEPICDEFESRGADVVYMTSSPDDPALKKKYEHIKAEFIGKGNRAFARLNTLRAGTVLSTTPGLDVFQWKRSKEVSRYVHIAHAADDITKYKMFGIDYYDAILLGGEYQGRQVRALERLRNLPEKSIEYVGMPYLDSMKQRLEKEKPEEENTDDITVLLAPSWGPNGILSKFGEELIRILSETGYKVIIRPHPQSYISEKEIIDSLKIRFSDTPDITWNNDNDNFEVLKQSDILISDFSGVIFDYSLVFDKPVIYADTNFDKSRYDCYWLDEKLWTFEILPEIGRKLTPSNMNDIKSLIRECLQDEKLQAGRDRARSETWMHMGDGAKRTVDFLLQ